MIAKYAVIFNSQLKEASAEYEATADKMFALVSQQPGYCGAESVRDPSGKGITISYWESLAAIQGWKENTHHREAKSRGKEKWYSYFDVKICEIL